MGTIDGPRSLHTGEMPALRALEEKVFRPSMPGEYPQVFNEDNAENLTVCFDGDRCVSHVGLVVRTASLLGCRVDVGLIGAVATDPDYRGSGLAGSCVDHAFARARRIGLDLLMISGDRDLYRRRDCVKCGRDLLFTLPAADIRAMGGPELSRPRFVLAPLDESELPLVRDAYRRESVRFLRRGDDYTELYRCGTVLNRLSDFYSVRTENQTFRGYIIVPRRAGAEGLTPIAEVGGDRRTVIDSLPQLLDRYEDVTSFALHVGGHDEPLRTILEEAGFASRPVAAQSCTIRVANFPQLMGRLRPLFEETLPRRTASGLSFDEEGDTCIFRFRDDALRVGRGDAARLIFGTPDGAEAALLERTGEGLAGVLREILPVPTLRYGLSYV